MEISVKWNMNETKMIELNKIYSEDCLETMGRMDDNFVDLTITSPPYDDLRTYNGHRFEFEKIAKSLFRVTKPGGIVVWVVGDSVKDGSETLTSFKQALYFNECGFNVHDTMIYQKTGMRFPGKNRYIQIFDYMFVFSKGKPKTTNLINDRPNRWAGYTVWGKNSIRKKEGLLVKVKDCKRYNKYGQRTNIWKYNNACGFGTKDKITYNHPASFPEKMVEDHIISWTNEGDIVYDPMIGSGTVAKVAILTNRNYIGSEVGDEYVKGALIRIEGLENLRGSRIKILEREMKERGLEEEEHHKNIEESEKKYSLMGKKWQPELPK